MARRIDETIDNAYQERQYFSLDGLPPLRYSHDHNFQYKLGPPQIHGYLQHAELREYEGLGSLLEVGRREL